MSLSNTDVKDTYSGNGSTIYFPKNTFTLPSISTGSEVAVYITNSIGVTSDKLTSGYTVDLDNKRVIYPDPYVEDDVLPTGYKITLIRETPKTQLAVFSGQSFNPKSFETSLDKTVMMVQEINDKVSRVVIADVTSDTNYTLPEAVAEKVLGWNAAGDGLINYDNPAAAEEQAIASAAAAGLSQTAAANSATNAANQVILAAAQVTLAATQATNAANSATSSAESALQAEVTNKNWKDGLNYVVDNICYPTAINSSLRAECVIAGTSGTTEPTWILGLITDGSITWMVRDVKNSSPTLSFNNVTITNTSTVITLASSALIGLRNSTGTRIINILTSADIALTPTLAASTPYYLWLVHTMSTNTTAMVVTTSYTAPSYDYYRHLGGRFTDASNRLYIINQQNEECQYLVDGTVLTGPRLMANGSGTTVILDVSLFVPVTARNIIGSLSSSSSSASGSASALHGGIGISVGSSADILQFNFPLLNQSISFYGSSSNTIHIYATGWIEQ